MVRRLQGLRSSGIHYLDVRTSGRIWGLEPGYCMMMIGGANREIARPLDRRNRERRFFLDSQCRRAHPVESVSTRKGRSALSILSMPFFGNENRENANLSFRERYRQHAYKTARSVEFTFICSARLVFCGNVRPFLPVLARRLPGLATYIPDFSQCEQGLDRVGPK
jgi:hypothetical protein